MMKYALCSNPLILYGRRGAKKQQLPETPEGITSKINISQQLTWRNVILVLQSSVAASTTTLLDETGVRVSTVLVFPEPSATDIENP